MRFRKAVLDDKLDKLEVENTSDNEGQGNPKTWRRKKKADLRLHGKVYTGFKKIAGGVYK